MSQLLTPELAQLLLSLLATIATVLLGKLVHFLTERTKSEFLRSLYSQCQDVVRDVVLAVEQDTASVLRAKEEGGVGKLTEQDAQYIKQKAIARARSILGQAVVANLAKTTNVDKLLGDLIEAQVGSGKYFTAAALRTETP